MAPRRKGRGRLQTWLDKINPEVLFGRSAVPRRTRTVFFHQQLPADYYDTKGRVAKEHVFVSNQVLTSKYTIITFLPRNLLEQFRRVANIFFAGIAILQFFPRFATISPGLVILPLIAVLAITAIKDGYEDVKRHQSDRRVNHTQVQVLEAPEWTNPNPVGQKSKTFVKGLPLRRKKRTADDVDPGNVKVKGASSPTSSGNDIGDTGGVGNVGWKTTIWEDLRVGDFVKILNNEPVPADIVICATSEEENVAYVETKNLDGETNLKSRNAIPALTSLRTAHACADPSTAKFVIEAEAPDANMYRLNAKVVMADNTIRAQPVDLQSVLLRGTVLRNTQWVIGVVVFTGVDTKVVINSSGAPSKRSKVEKQMNPQVGLNLLLLAIMTVVCAIVESILDRQYHRDGALWSLGEDTSSDNPNINGLATWANALITFQNIIPISLYISIEVVRSLQAAFIHFDSEMWYEKTDQATLARSWNLADDLGQIEYVFSDKTGTLTQNAMVFRQCSIGGDVYRGDEDSSDELSSQKGSPRTSRTVDEEASGGDTSGTLAVPSPQQADSVKLAPGVLKRFHDSVLKADLEASMLADGNSPAASKARTLNGFFTVLALCHTVIASVDPKSGEIEYKAQSPDEAALVQAAADVGFIFKGRDREKLSLKTPFVEHLEEYELLNVLEFNSSRKRMSVIVRKLDENDSRIFLLCKGADNVIFERLKTGNDDLRQKTEAHLEEFAGEGLRTLCLAYKVLNQDQYEAWNHRYHDATVQLEGREQAIEEVSAEIETDLRLLGATAIEDKLQDGVPETIADLKRAGIKVWVATGDKLETAIAIGYSTNLIARESNLILIRGGRAPVRQQLLDSGRRFFGHDFTAMQSDARPSMPSRASFSRRRSTDSHALRRVDTSTSIVGEDNGSRPGGFVLVIDGAALQEALQEDNRDTLLELATRCEAVLCCRVSPLQKAHIVDLVKEGLGSITLAIGDGANDVSMIQAAHVGVGISGEEGLQAVNSSDYAIAQFRFLKRLLLVHGHYSYARNANMIVNFFYKNIVCIGVLWWFQIYCAWSTQYVFDYTYLLFWNVFWSLATVIAIGIFDRFIDDDMLMALPELYRYGREGRWFGIKVFFFYILDACYQSAVIFFFSTYSYVTVSARSDGYDAARLEYSTTMVIATVMVVNLFNGLNTTAWTSWVFFAVSIGPVLCWLFTVVYSDISPGWFYVATYGNDHFLFRSALYWFNMPLLIVLAILPRYLYKYIQGLYFPTDIDILRARRKIDPKLDVWHHPLLGGKHAHPTHPLDEKSGTMPVRPSIQSRRSIGSRTDMATGIQFIHRGFDFSTEEDGVSMRRMQSNLSERRGARHYSDGDPKRSKHGIFSSLRLSTRRKGKQSPSPPNSPPLS